MDEEIAKFADLVQRLRYKAMWDDSGDLEEAADAIEELSIVVESYRHRMAYVPEPPEEES